eukprot:320368-Rhodomonas_salina.2
MAVQDIAYEQRRIIGKVVPETPVRLQYCAAWQLTRARDSFHASGSSSIRYVSTVHRVAAYPKVSTGHSVACGYADSRIRYVITGHRVARA